MAYNKIKDKSIKHKCNVLSNILSPKKRAKYTTSHYSLILQGCMNTRSGKGNCGNFKIVLDSRSSSMIVIGKLTSKLKQKEAEKLLGKSKPISSQPLRR